MKKKFRVVLSLLLVLCIALFVVLYFFSSTSAVLAPKGEVGLQQRNLIYITTLLMMIVVIPVFFITALFAWKYRENNAKAKYSPELEHSVLWEIIWWGIPIVIICVLGVITWKKSHELDPYKPLVSNAQPLTIQAIALQWKWLFIYPEQKIATVNFIQIPEQVPIHFEITADAPMNSFWIPELGGQIYAMPGAKTELNLIANEVGTFRGSSSNLSGNGFAGMIFMTKASSQADFDQWVKEVQQSSNSMDLDTYYKLVKPSEYDPVSLYKLADEDLFETVLMQNDKPMKK